MKSACIPYTALPGTSALFADYLYRFDGVRSFYRHDPHDPHALIAAAKAADLPVMRREAVVAALRPTNPDTESLDLLARPGTAAVITGQQVSLFGGPAYTIYKALTAAKLASDLNREGHPAVPLFWMATEDHDLPEADHVYVYGPDFRPIRIHADASPELGQPVGSVLMPEPPLDALRTAIQDLPFADEVLPLLEESYRAGTTFGASFRELMKRLLKPFGFVFVDPLIPALRHVAAPFFREALEQSDELSAAVEARSRELTDAGYHAQVQFGASTSLFLWLKDGRRQPLKRNGNGYQLEGKPLSREEMEANIENLSPNAILRPVMQDYLFPTAAYVGGPAEIAYFAQSDVLYRGLLGRAPVILPRSGFTVLDAKTAGLMERYGLRLPDLLTGEHVVRERIATKLIPKHLNAKFDEAITAVKFRLDELGAAVQGFDPTLVAALEKSRAKILYQIEKTHRKTGREAARREERAGAGAARVCGLAAPERHLQERLYSIFPLIAQHGPGLLDTLYEHVGRGCPDHVVLEI